MCKYMVFKDVTLADFTIFGNMGFAFLVNFWVIFNTVTKSHSKNGKFESLVPLILSDITMIFWANHEIMQSYAPVMMLVHSLVFSGICSKLIISSVTKMKFDYFHLDVLIEFLFAFESIYIKILPPVSMLLILSLFIVYRYFSFTYKVTHQIATYMNISVYKVD